ncbi:MAG: CPBP family intramembrane metalloprotease [Prevotella sp.]|jgi:membrane protease YdiL (CAAX protease family)|nr:type II CAAX endopeptidase family protein [Prevotella sp.]MCI2088434.1 CPBP family intramembrane metalloprotease [Prevotella sp.]MCI2125990.1 CPBP family intramembrane metalloprotease [Prevotella sp.]
MTKTSFFKKAILDFFLYLLFGGIVIPLIILIITGLPAFLLYHYSLINFIRFYEDTIGPISLFVVNLVILKYIWWKYKLHLSVNKFIPNMDLMVIVYVILITMSYFLIDSYIGDIIILPDLNVTDFSILDRNTFGVISTCFLSPLVEEFIFRGSVERYLLKWRKNPWWAIVISAFLFGLIHLNPAQSFSAFFAGLLFGWIYYRSKSLWPSIIIHSLNNILCLLIDWKYGINCRVIDMFNQEPHLMYFVLSLCAVVLLITLYRFNKYTKTIK